MSSLDETYTYTYDHAGRLFETNHQVGNNARVNLATNTYDELGRLSSVRHHDNDELTTDYTYNVRSWLKSIRTKNLFDLYSCRCIRNWLL